MKFSGSEKVILGFTAFMVAAFLFCMSVLFISIKDAGGIRQVIVDSGKEIKSISKDINDGSK